MRYLLALLLLATPAAAGDRWDNVFIHHGEGAEDGIGITVHRGSLGLEVTCGPLDVDGYQALRRAAEGDEARFRRVLRDLDAECARELPEEQLRSLQRALAR